MEYLLTVTILVTGSVLLGVWRGKSVAGWCDAHPRPSAIVLVGSALTWLVLAYFARMYAEGDGFGWGAAEWFAHRGKWYIFTVFALVCMNMLTHAAGLGRLRTCALILCELLVVWLLVWRTMPSFVWLPRTTIRDGEGHIRQSIEYTCGPVSLGNMLENSFGRPSPTERELARLSGTTIEGTASTGLINAAAALGLELVACRKMRLDELARMDSPAIVQISTIPAVKHATLLMRVDGEFLDFIDPAYGYQRVPVGRFEQIWYGKTAVFRVKDSEYEAENETAHHASY